MLSDAAVLQSLDGVDFSDQMVTCDNRHGRSLRRLHGSLWRSLTSHTAPKIGASLACEAASKGAYNARNARVNSYGASRGVKSTKSHKM